MLKNSVATGVVVNPTLGKPLVEGRWIRLGLVLESTGGSIDARVVDGNRGDAFAPGALDGVHALLALHGGAVDGNGRWTALQGLLSMRSKRSNEGTSKKAQRAFKSNGM